MKTILCYGDSNTWGYNPRGGRYDYRTRWPVAMAALLNRDVSNPDYWVIEEGLNGRTSCLEDPIEGDRNGLRQLIPILRSHRPLDLVIFMLGSNDLKNRFNPGAYDVSHGAQLVAKAILGSETGPDNGAPRVLMVSPPPLVESPAFRQLLAPDAVEISRRLAPYYRACAKECGAAFFDAGAVVESSGADGVHWEAEGHAAFAEAMAKEALRLL